MNNGNSVLHGTARPKMLEMLSDFDYSKLRGRIREKYSTEKAFAEDLGMSRHALGRRLNNKADFTIGEIHKAAKPLQLSSMDVNEMFF